MEIYRKLKDYIATEHKICTVTWTIFGDLRSRNCTFCYEDEKENWREYTPCGVYAGEYDFLLEYYVISIRPKYRIKNDKIETYLNITLSREKLWKI